MLVQLFRRGVPQLGKEMKFDPPVSPMNSPNNIGTSDMDTSRAILQVPSLASTSGTVDSKAEEKKQDDDDEDDTLFNYRPELKCYTEWNLRGIPYSPVRIRSGRGAARSVRSSTPPSSTATPAETAPSRPHFFVSNRGRGKAGMLRRPKQHITLLIRHRSLNRL
jgi:hypothetical protein